MLLRNRSNEIQILSGSERYYLVPPAPVCKLRPVGLRPCYMIVNCNVGLQIIAVCYALIIRHLRNKSFHGSQGRSDRRLSAVIYMCASLVVVFLVCWLPYHAQHMAKLSGIKGRSVSDEDCGLLRDNPSTIIKLKMNIKDDLAYYFRI